MLFKAEKEQFFSTLLTNDIERKIWPNKDGNEILTFPYPFYPPEIFPVFGYLESDYNYIENYKNNCKNTPIEKMNLSQIRTMFTWLVQNERFCDGFIADEIENGNLLALFRRLNELVGDEK